MKKTVVLGASPNPERYAHRAVRLLQQKGHEVVPIGIRSGNIDGIDIQQGTPAISDVDTVTLYLSPNVQSEYYDYIISLAPKRVIFNPGTENRDFYQYLHQHAPQIEQEIACTLVLLNIGNY